MTRNIITGRSHLDYGRERLHALCRGLGLDASKEQEAVAIFRHLVTPWGEVPIGSEPRWPSDISDDHTPYEFSVALEGNKPELRMLVEAQAARPSIEATWEAGRLLTRRLVSEFGISTDRLDAIEDLFVPTDPSARFGVWHAASMRPDGLVDFKIYLNPQAQGRDLAPYVVATALERLGFASGLGDLPALREQDEIKYFSLDLNARGDARVKVYTAHYGATTDDIEAALAPALYHVPGEAREFCRMLGESDGPFTSLPIQICLAFASGNEAPKSGTIHFPVRAYAPTDAVARERIVAYLSRDAKALYSGAIDMFANRSLDDGVGMQSYASLRQQRGGSRLTVYLATEAYTVAPVSMSPNSFATPAANASFADEGERPSNPIMPVSGVLPILRIDPALPAALAGRLR